MKNTDTQWLRWANDIRAIAQNGLTYCSDVFDQERYQQLIQLAAEIVASHSDHPAEFLQELFIHEKGYATPKVDVRGVVFRDNEILLVKEISDGKWTLPGGWVDINQSPSEAVVKEILEESGFTTRAVKLLALYDKQRHDHPPEINHVYKCFFLCEIVSGEPKTSIETSAVDFFSKDNLPSLSLPRVTEKQIMSFFDHAFDADWPTQFD